MTQQQYPAYINKQVQLNPEKPHWDKPQKKNNGHIYKARVVTHGSKQEYGIINYQQQMNDILFRLKGNVKIAKQIIELNTTNMTRNSETNKHVKLNVNIKTQNKGQRRNVYT